MLTSCDAFERFPPTPQKYLEVAARSRILMWIVAYTAKFKGIATTSHRLSVCDLAADPADIIVPSPIRSA